MSERHRRVRSIARVRLRFAADDRLVSLVRRGDPMAFEILYGRHARELLSFCRHMLGSQHDAEDAVQSTFASAYRALVADDREIDLRPWLFAIARNACISILRQRRPTAEAIATIAHCADPAAQVQQRDELRQALTSLLELPHRQRTALVLAELHGLSHSEIGAVLEVRPEQVKAYVYQARSSLISERNARDADCREIREQLATARGPALLRSNLRRHVRTCAGCRVYSEALSHQRRTLRVLLPLGPALALKRRAVEAVFGRAAATDAWVAPTSAGAPATGASAELLGGSVGALAVKLLAGVACVLVAGSSVSSTALPRHAGQQSRRAQTSPVRLAHLRLTAAVKPVDTAARPTGDPLPHTGATEGVVAGGVAGHTHGGSMNQHSSAAAGASGGAGQASISNPSGAHRTSKEALGGSKGKEAHGAGKSELPHGKSEVAHGAGKGGLPHGKSEVAHGAGKGGLPHGKSEVAHGAGNGEQSHGKAEEPHGNSDQAHGKSEAVHGSSEGPHGTGEVHGAGKAEEPHGNSEEVHGNSEQLRGNSEQPHGNGAGK